MMQTTKNQTQQCMQQSTSRPVVQAQLRLGSTSDPLEHEANRIAAQVTTGEVSLDPGRVTLRASSGAGVQGLPSGFEGCLNSLSSGQPLSKSVRGKFEGRMQHDFRQVRVHTGQQAAGLAQSINANAFTHGNDIVFGAGKYTPESTVGQRLLAHELTHTIQQTGVIQRDPNEDLKERVQARLDLFLPDHTRITRTRDIMTGPEVAMGYADLIAMMDEAKMAYIPDFGQPGRSRRWRNMIASHEESRVYYASKDGASQTEVWMLELRADETSELGMEEYNEHLYLKRTRKARKRAARLRDRARNVIRAQFLDSKFDDGATTFIWSMAEASASLVGALTLALESSSKVANTVSKFGPSVLALRNALSGWSSITPGQTGTSATALPMLQNALSLAAVAAGTLSGPLAVCMAHIGPMLKVIDSHMKVVYAGYRHQNDKSAGTLGYPVFIGKEPGQKPMWNYMFDVMKAGKASDIPVPPPSEVQSFFKNHRDLINKNIAIDRRGGFDMPEQYSHGAITKAMYWDMFQKWQYHCRKTIWILLYGKRQTRGIKKIQ